ncbi:sensor histidine kinase [Paenibacillus rigui]|uniref:Sensor histidine kinase n=1 Tax=Paenibacillus rigui TaxID=554312 RepID=A0A229UIW2_9BACL|nr:sensor histidine kinase [Paenibacillus rigui]OXM83320.1 sensor histidine kinase [Paenibacillus rigui]
MNRFFYSSSLKKRIWIACITLTVLCITATGVTSYYIASRVTENNAFQLSQNTLNKSAQVLDERLRHIVVSSSTLMISESFKRMMQDAAMRNQESYYQHLSALQSPFAQIKLNESTIESVLISTPIGDFYPTNAVRNMGMPFQSTPMYDLLRQSSTPSIWVGAHEDMLFTGRSRVISLLLEPYTESLNSEVYIVINIKEDAIKQDVYQDFTGKGAQFLLLDSGGKDAVPMATEYDGLKEDTAFLQSMEAAKAGHFEYVLSRPDKTTLLVNYSHLRLVEDWTLISLQSKSELLSQMRLIQWWIVVIMAACALLAFVFSNVLSERLLRPLYKLQGLMHKVERDNTLDVRFDSHFNDEVTKVGHSFNRMLAQLTALIDEVKASEREKRKSEIKALQAQIDPHFLYNTLNTILWKSETAERQDVRDMIISLSKLFQLGLNNGNELTTLEKELEHVRQYMEIQKKCYEGLFAYVIELKAPEWNRLPMIKILLQPLVENSILHGFQHMEHGGFIYIGIDQDGDCLRLTVEDNGSGMDAEEVYAQLTQVTATRSSYALSNVYSRLQLYYGSEARMQLTSEPGVKTVVTLWIPLAGGEPPAALPHRPEEAM